MAIVDFAGNGYKSGAIDFTDYDIITVASLPAAGEDTMKHIYQVGPDANNNYDRYYTQKTGYTYSWVPMGSTQMDLSDYATNTEVSQLRQEVTADVSQLEHKVDDLVAYVNENGLFFVDEDLNIGVYIDGNGIHAPNIPEIEMN